jgi:hypothetical protein
MSRVLADRENFDVPTNEDQMREALVQLAEYAQELETKSAKQSKASAAEPVVTAKSEEQIQAAADKLRRVCVSQITKQMTVRHDLPLNSPTLYPQTCPCVLSSVHLYPY